MAIWLPQPKTRSRKGLTSSTVTIGIDEDGNLQFLSDPVRAEHIYVLGKSGTGKTMFVCNIVAQDLSRGACVVFLDLIGTGVPYMKRLLGAVNLQAMARERGRHAGLSERLRQQREERFSRITILELEGEDFPHRFNPLEPVAWMSTAEQAEAFAASIERMLGGKLSEMRQLHLNLVALASVLIETGGATVADMVELCCMNTATLEKYLKRLDRKRAKGRLGVPVRRDLIRHYMSAFFAQAAGRERRDLVASTLRALAMLLTDPVAARFLSSPVGNLDLEAVMNRGESLLVGLPPHNLHTQAALSSLILGRLTALAMRRDSLKVQDGEYPQVHLIVDEFQRVFTEETAAEIAVLRNKGVSLILAHQSGSQPPFHVPEGRGMLESVRDNCSTTVLLRMGRQDAVDLAPGCFEPDGRMIKMQREEVSVSRGESSGHTKSSSAQETLGESHTSGTSQANGVSQGRGQVRSSSATQGQQSTTSEGSSTSQSVGESTTRTRTNGLSRSEGNSQGTTRGTGLAKSTSTSRSQGTSQGHGQSQSSNQSVNLANSYRHQDVGRALVMSGHNQGRTSGEGESHSTSASSSDTQSSGTNRAQSWNWGNSQSVTSSQARSHSNSVSHGENRSQTHANTRSSSQGESTSHTQGESDSTTRSETQTQGTSEARSVSKGTSTGQNEGTTQGQSHSESRRQVVEYYSVSEETAIRSYELMSLPNREVIVLQRGQGPLKRTRMRTLDMPLDLVTQIGSLDGLADLERVSAPRPATPEPTLGVLDRLALQQLELDPEDEP